MTYKTILYQIYIYFDITNNKISILDNKISICQFIAYFDRSIQNYNDKIISCAPINYITIDIQIIIFSYSFAEIKM